MQDFSRSFDDLYALVTRVARTNAAQRDLALLAGIEVRVRQWNGATPGESEEVAPAEDLEFIATLEDLDFLGENFEVWFAGRAGRLARLGDGVVS